MAKYERYVIESEGVTLPKMCFRRFKGPYPGIVEQILEEQPGLAALSPFLPVGTVVYMPVPAPRTEVPVKVISLWD